MSPAPLYSYYDDMAASSETSPLIPHPVEVVETYVDDDACTTSSLRKHENNVELPETAPTGRQIGRTSAFILVLSRIIGSGIFAMPGSILQSVGSPGLALLLWVAGALIAWFGLSIDLEYGCMLPRSGGIKVYLEYTYPRPRFLASTMVAIHCVLLGFTASNCIVFAKYVLFAFEAELTDFNVKALAVALMTLITIIHSTAYRTGIFVQNILGWLKILLICFMILTGLFVVILGIQPTHPGQHNSIMTMSDLWKGSDWSANTLATALYKIFYSYAGLENLNNVLNEVKNPIKTLKQVPPFALVTACLLYVLINVAYLAVVPLQEIRQSQELIAALFFNRVFGEGFGNKFLPIAIALSAAGNVMVVTFSLSRINQEIARQGFLPFSAFFATSKPFGTPLGGLIIHYLPSILVIIIPPSDSIYSFLAELEGFVAQFFVLAVGIGLLILRKNKPDMLRPFRAWTPGVYFKIGLGVLLLLAPFFPRSGKSKERDQGGIWWAMYAVVGSTILTFSVLYWYIWTILVPRYWGYRLEEEVALLDDGSSVTKLVHKEL